MRVYYQAVQGEDDVWIDDHDAVHGVPRIGDSVHCRLQYRVVDVIWKPRDGVVSVILEIPKKKRDPATGMGDSESPGYATLST